MTAMTTPTSETKVCTKCSIVKPIANFYKKDKGTRYMTECKECIILSRREYYKANREQILLKVKAYQAVNKDHKAAMNRKYRNGPGKPIRKAHNAARRAKKKQALLPWVDRKAIAEIYANCPEGYHVDHIIALNNPLVSGLHIPCNLQYLPASENIKKKNKFPPKEQWLAHAEEQKD